VVIHSAEAKNGVVAVRSKGACNAWTAKNRGHHAAVRRFGSGRCGHARRRIRCASERHLAVPVIVPTGRKTAAALRELLLTEVHKLRIGADGDPNAPIGSVVTAEHQQKTRVIFSLSGDMTSYSPDGMRNCCRGRTLPIIVKAAM
jgi:hypothetical protein